MRLLGTMVFLVFFTIVSHAHVSHDLVESARAQIGKTVGYDGRYYRINYPMGDISITTGVCSDVIIRAYRHHHIDLQQLVHEDMQSAWNAYPKLWGLKTTDRNIDHRRVPNLEVFFARKGQSLSLTDLSTFQAGDIVSWRLSNHLPHIGIVSDRRNSAGIPLIIHNIGGGVREEDALLKYRIVGHYRY